MEDFSGKESAFGFGVNSPKTMNSVQKKFRNQDFLYGISLFRLLSENRVCFHSKIAYFCIFFAEIGILNTNRILLLKNNFFQ